MLLAVGCRLQTAAQRPLFFLDDHFLHLGPFEDVHDLLQKRVVQGLAADLVLIDGDIETVDSADLGGTGIALTVAGGNITHQGAGFAA